MLFSGLRHSRYWRTAFFTAALEVLFLWITLSFTSADTLPVLGVTRSVKLNTYNNYFFSNDAGWTKDQMLQALAAKDNIVLHESWNPSIGSSVKSLNPNAKMYMYYALCVKSLADVDGISNDASTHQLTPLTKAIIDANDWWLRNKLGQLVPAPGGNCYYLDVGRPGFKQAYLNGLLSRISGRGYNGMVFDFWMPGGPVGVAPWRTPAGAYNPAYRTDQDWFTRAWQPFIKYVMSGLRSAGYRVIGNCAGEYISGSYYCDWQRTQIDGTVYEQWAVDWPSNGGNWLSPSTISTRIAHFNADPLEAWTADYGLRMSDPIYDQKLKVSLAMYYIAVPSSQTYRSFGLAGNLKIFWEDVWDLQIGTPAAPSVKSATSYFWSRKYTHGLVLLNYEPTKSIAYTLPHAYVDEHGTTYSGTINVAPHTGLILADCN